MGRGFCFWDVQASFVLRSVGAKSSSVQAAESAGGAPRRDLTPAAVFLPT